MNINSMDRVHQIQMHPLFRELCEKLHNAEKDRVFCRHTMEHFLDVARLMYIYSLEDGADIGKDLIYAAALLHDLGRYEQSVSGTPHHIAGSQIAGEILKDCSFTAHEIQSVQDAISGHRNQESSTSTDRLTAYLYRADKASRNCFSCPVRSACNWPEEKMNFWITY